MPLAAAIKLIPVPDAPFYTYLTPWKQAPQIVISEGGAITAVLLGQKGELDGTRYPEGTKFLEAVIGGETVRVPMPPFPPSYYPPPTEPFFSRLRYAFFPNTHDNIPTVAPAPAPPKPDIAWL